MGLFHIHFFVAHDVESGGELLHGFGHGDLLLDAYALKVVNIHKLGRVGSGDAVDGIVFGVVGFYGEVGVGSAVAAELDVASMNAFGVGGEGDGECAALCGEGLRLNGEFRCVGTGDAQRDGAGEVETFNGDGT